MDRKICIGITTLHKQCTKYAVPGRNYCSIHSEETDIRNAALPKLCVGFRREGIKCSKKAVHNGKYCALHSEETDKVNSPKALQQCEGLTKMGKRCSRQAYAKFCTQHTNMFRCSDGYDPFKDHTQDEAPPPKVPPPKVPPPKVPPPKVPPPKKSTRDFFEEFRRAFEQYTQHLPPPPPPPPLNPQVDHITPAFEYFKSTRNDSFESVSKKYKKLALEYHPDKPTGSHTNFVELVKHYDIIKKYYKR